jgi:acetoin utilization protein AcuB
MMMPACLADDKVLVDPIDPGRLTLSAIMKKDVVPIGMDTTLQAALEVCTEQRIRHLPVLDDEGRLAGILTDRDLRYQLSPRLRTLSENNSDRASMHRRVHLVMTRNVVVGSPDMTVAEGARLLVKHRVGCLPIVDSERKLAGLVTTTDFLILLAGESSRDSSRA